MPSTYSTSLRIELQADGENASTWGQKANNDFSLFEQSIAGRVAVPVGGAVDVTLTATNGVSDQSRNMIIEATGVLTGNINLIVPSVTKLGVFYNNTSGAFSLTVKTAAGTGVVVAQGQRRLLYCDGTNVVPAIAPVGIADGGTGGTTQATGRAGLGSSTVGDALFIAASVLAAQTTLALVPGTNVQAFDTNTAKINVAQAWTKPQRIPFVGITDQATLAWDQDAAPYASVTLAANRTMGLPTNIRDGQIVVLKIGASGAFSVTAWNAAFDWGADGIPTPSSTSGKFDIYTFIGAGTTKLDAVGFKKGLSQ